LYTLFYCLEYNLSSTRTDFGDEYVFWKVRAELFSNDGFLNAHQMRKDIQQMHPFGIPFITAFPTMLIGIATKSSLTFLPFIIILSLFLFLHAIKKDSWTFLFFYFATFLSFHYEGWMSVLTYRLVYGDGTLMLIFLLIIYEMKLLQKQSIIKPTHFMLLSFSMGIAIFTKFPVGHFGYIFFIMLLFLHGNIKTNLRSKIIILLSSCMLLMSPLIIWKFFSNHFEVFRRNMHQNVATGDYSQINISMLINIVEYLTNGGRATTALIFLFLSFILIFFTFRRKEYLYFTPIPLLIFMVLF